MEFNQQIIDNEELIREIEEKGNIICKDKPNYVCVPMEDIYYYYNNNIIRIQKTVAQSLDEMEDLKKAILNATYINIEPETHAQINDYIGSIKLEERKMELVECVQENLLSVDPKIFLHLINFGIFEKSEDKKIEMINELQQRIQKEDVQKKTTAVMVNVETRVNGFNTITSLNDIELNVRNIFNEMISKDGSRFWFNVNHENTGIAHQIIDKYREIYKIFSGTDKNNYTNISILFIKREKRGLLYGTLR